MLTGELLRKIRKIEITTKKVVSETFSGQYHSVFKGQGIEFSEVRPYIPGDDVRFIDWNVSARQNSLFVKRFSEERELTVFIVADVSGSTGYGSRKRLKSEIIAELSSIFAFSAIWNKDKVGAILFTDKVERYIPPKKGNKHVLSIISEILSFEPESKRTDIDRAIRFALNVLKRRAVIFLLSDFIGTGFDRSLGILARKHDTIAIRLFDPTERKIDLPLLISLQDPESGEDLILDNSHYNTNMRLQKFIAEYEQGIREIFKKNQVDFLEIDITADYVPPLVRLFRMRQKEQSR